MGTATNKKATKARAKRGLGRLYKRGKDGKELPASSDAKSPYYLEYRVNGKREKICLTDKHGNKITTLEAAEKARINIVAPLLAEDKVEQLKSIKAKLETAQTATAKAFEEINPALKLTEAWNEYRTSHNRPKSGDRTLVRYESCINAFNDWIKEAYPAIREMREVGTEHAEAYADHLESKKLSPSSFNIYLNSLAMVWGVLEKKARITQNPFAWDRKSRTGIQRKNIKAESLIRKKRALTLEEVNQAIETAEGDYRTLLIILVCTGQRLVDGVKLQWREIDFAKNIITLTPAKTAKRTGKQVYVPILPQLRKELQSKMQTGRYVLPELVEAYNRDRSAITKQIRKIFDAAGLNAHKETDLRTGQAIVETGAHSLRHSFVTIARLAGFPDALIMKITGHTSADMIDHYTAFNEKLVSSLAANIPQALPKGNKGFIQAPEQKESLPGWAIEKLESMDAQNWYRLKSELLEEANT